ncbi:hypothetical protein QJS04_geneDACA012092 [Acorus gramineus]|uniref:Uncharacterized protein n=1 Tax=Acorus gramineus TaxID=55184 RepID=A0AAV9B7R9_ACOGR|nr:hypothetical protein QJS04_geneDACA012092 [Acorus gramineus]
MASMALATLAGPGNSAGSSDDIFPWHRHDKSRLSVSRPSWVVRTESNVWKQEWKKPDPPCVVCKGNGRVHCHYCQGKGRTNCAHLAMLPKGEWPKWCRTCGGSGLGYCPRCLGTGEYRDIMGFHFMKMNENTRSSLGK